MGVERRSKGGGGSELHVGVGRVGVEVSVVKVVNIGMVRIETGMLEIVGIIWM